MAVLSHEGSTAFMSIEALTVTLTVDLSFLQSLTLSKQMYKLLMFFTNKINNKISVSEYTGVLDIGIRH